MHYNNRLWLADLQKRYPYNFSCNAKVLEIGSKIWDAPPNDSIRSFFDSSCRYVGVDREFGEGVNIVCEAELTSFDENYFDTLAMFSLFEHDPDWRLTLKHNLQWLAKGGLFITCFGAEGNLPHLMRWKLVPHQEFLDFVINETALDVVDSFFEEDRYAPRDCAGAFDVVAIKRF